MRCIYNGIYPCGKCPACLANRQRAFCFRLDQEKEQCSFYFWLSLTYDDEFIPKIEGTEEYCFSKDHCRSFFEKVRKRYEPKGFKFKHFLVSEYGPTSTHRPHYHLLLLVYSGLSTVQSYNARIEMRDFLIHNAWQYGFVKEKAFHGRVLSYLTKYCTKPELAGEDHTMKPFTLISRGIGLKFLDSLTEEHKNQMYETLDFTVRYGKSRIQLPRYYTDRMFPHSKAYLESLMPEGDAVLDPGAWEEYEKVKTLRDRLYYKQRDRDRKRAALDMKEYQTVESVQSEIKDTLSYQQGTLQLFRSKIKKRKNL